MTDDTAATAASNNPLLSTLVTAVTEAGLVDTLNSDGPFTIFAPTNDAFAAIPPADLEAVLADTELLTSILTYHVIAGESCRAPSWPRWVRPTTVNGADITFEIGRRRLAHGERSGDGRLRRRPDRQRHGAHHRRGADALISRYGTVRSGGRAESSGEEPSAPRRSFALQPEGAPHLDP